MLVPFVNIELFKLSKQKRTYFALGAIFLLEMVVFAIAYDQGTEILDTLLESLQDTFYFQGDLLNGNLLTYFLLNSLWFHLPLLLMIIVTGLITIEYQDGTLRTVFLQPVSKTVYILAKFITAIIFTILVVLLLALTAFVFSYGLFGKGDLVVYFESLNFFESTDAFVRLVLGFISGTFTMLFYASLCVTLAIVLKETLRTWIVATLALIMINLASQLYYSVLGWDYWFFPRLINTWQKFFYYDIPWNSILWSHGVLLLYTLLIVLGGIWHFKKSDIE